MSDPRTPRSVSELETPVPIVDADRMRRNLERVGRYAAEHGVSLRPHIKTHKSPIVAAEQLRFGARGLTCATPREAEVMSEVCDDLLVAYPTVGVRARRIAALPAATKVTVMVDSAEAIRTIGALAAEHGRTIGVLIELDVGMKRVGVATADEAIALARIIGEHDALEYAGIGFYPGHIREAVDRQQPALDALSRHLEQTVAAMTRAGFAPAVVSGGSTPTLFASHRMPGVTEVRAGTFVYNDRTTAEVGACDPDDCALAVLATVVSTAVPGQAVIDAGSKALGREPMRGADAPGFGALREHPEVTVAAMSEEHGMLDLSRSAWRPRIGDRVSVIPNHVCIVVHLHEAVYPVRDEAVLGRWPAAARGRESEIGALLA